MIPTIPARLRTTLLALPLALSALAASTPSLLFNGKDLSGWHPMHQARFEARNQTLVLAGGTGWLRSDREVGDFILDVELRPTTERYDSGLLFRAGLEGKPWPSEGWQINLRRDMWGALVKGHTRVAPSPVEGPDIEDDTPWSHFHLEVRGSKASLDLNGKRLWETDTIDRPRGFLGIQAEERAFEFRNLRLQTLD